MSERRYSGRYYAQVEVRPPWRTRFKRQLETSDQRAAGWLKSKFFIGWLPRPTQPGQYMLDMGCGAGQVLDRARSLGWVAEGCELSDATAQAARRKGYTCYTGNWPEQLPARRYHLVVMSNVLEHLLEPGPYLSAVARGLRADGIALITLPNFGSAQAAVFEGKWWALLPPEHIWYYHLEHVTAVLRTAGLAVAAVRLQSHVSGVLNPSTIRLQWQTYRRHRGSTGGFVWQYALSLLGAPCPVARAPEAPGRSKGHAEHLKNLASRRVIARSPLYTLECRLLG